MSENVRETSFDEILEIKPANFRIFKWRPGNAKRMHAIPIAKLVRDKCAIFSAAAGDDNIEAAVFAPISIAKLFEFSRPRVPIHDMVFFERPLACRTDAFIIESGSRTLIRDHAIPAVHDLLWEVIELTVKGDLCDRTVIRRFDVS